MTGYIKKTFLFVSVLLLLILASLLMTLVVGRKLPELRTIKHGFSTFNQHEQSCQNLTNQTKESCAENVSESIEPVLCESLVGVTGGDCEIPTQSSPSSEVAVSIICPSLVGVTGGDCPPGSSGGSPGSAPGGGGSPIGT